MEVEASSTSPHTCRCSQQKSQRLNRWRGGRYSFLSGSLLTSHDDSSSNSFVGFRLTVRNPPAGNDFDVVLLAKLQSFLLLHDTTCFHLSQSLEFFDHCKESSSSSSVVSGNCSCWLPKANFGSTQLHNFRVMSPT